MASYSNSSYSNSFYDLTGVYFNSTNQSSSLVDLDQLDARYLIKSSGGTISNNLIVSGSVDIQTSLTIPNIGNVETSLDGKQDVIGDGDLSISKTDGLQTALTELDELTTSHITQISNNDTDITALQGRLDTEEPKTTALQTLTASHTTDIASNTADILTKQDTITTSTDLTPNSITTQETLTSKICGLSFTKEATVSRMLGGTQSLIAFNSASGNTTYDCGGVLFLRFKEMREEDLRA